MVELYSGSNWRGLLKTFLIRFEESFSFRVFGKESVILFSQKRMATSHISPLVNTAEAFSPYCYPRLIWRWILPPISTSDQLWLDQSVPASSCPSQPHIRLFSTVQWQCSVCCVPLAPYQTHACLSAGPHQTLPAHSINELCHCGLPFSLGDQPPLRCWYMSPLFY